MQAFGEQEESGDEVMLNISQDASDESEEDDEEMGPSSRHVSTL